MKRAPLHRCSKSLQSCIQMGTAPQPNHPLPAHDNSIPPARAETSRALLFQHSTKALVEKGSTPPHGQDPSHKGLPVDLHMTSKMRTCLSNDFKAPRKTPVNLAQGNTFWCSLLHTRNIRCCISHCRWGRGRAGQDVSWTLSRKTHTDYYFRHLSFIFKFCQRAFSLCFKQFWPQFHYLSCLFSRTVKN